jgi:hypothetical protein
MDVISEMLCPLCLEDDWHRMWCDHHPVNQGVGGMWPPVMPVVGVWPPPLMVATPDGEMVQTREQQEWGGIPIEDTLFNELPVLNSETDGENEQNRLK